MTAAVVDTLPLLASAPAGISRLRELILHLAANGRLGRADGEWRAIQLRELVISSGAGWSPSCDARARSGQEWGVLKVSAVSWGQFQPDENKALPKHLEPRPELEVQTGDFLVSRANTADLVARSVVVKDTPPKLMLSDKIVRLLLSDACDPRFVQIANSSPEARRYYARVAGGTSSSMKNVSREHILALPILLPPIDEQKRIVAKVDELMALCDRLEARKQDAEAAHARLVQALLDSLTQARDVDEFQACWQRLAGQLEGVFTTEASIDELEGAVLELAITGRMSRAGSTGDAGSDLATVRQERARNLTPAKLKKHDADAAEVYWACPYELPERWAWVSLAAVVLQITDGTHHTPTYVDEGTPFISVKDLDGETVSFEDCRHIPHEEHVAINERCNPERGDLLICRIGTLGRPTIVDTDRAFSIFVSVGLLKMPKSIELAEYIHLVLRSPLAYRQYDRIKAGGSHTNKLNLGDIPKIMVPLPPEEERAEILAVVREVLGLCSLLRSRIAAARGKHAKLAESLVARAMAV